MPLTLAEIKVLASGPPPAIRPPKWKFNSAQEGNREISRLETILGIPPGNRTGSLADVNSRVFQLEQLVSLNGLPPAMPTSITPAPPAAAQSPVAAPDTITFAQWRAKGAADQISFARDGGKMSKDEFLLMPAKSQSVFLSAGGKIARDVIPDAPKTKTPPANSIWRKDFEKLSPKQQSAHFAAKGKIHD